MTPRLTSMKRHGVKMRITPRLWHNYGKPPLFGLRVATNLEQRAYLLEDDKDTPALSAIREAHARGAAIGGTSAGAAIMSASMITQGDSLTALTGSKSGEALEVAHGLGFPR